jgi:hypothetical protein
VPKVHTKLIKRPRNGFNKKSKGQPKAALVRRTGLSGVPPDSVRCTTGQCPVHQGTPSQTLHLREFSETLRYNSPDCPVHHRTVSGAPEERDSELASFRFPLRYNSSDMSGAHLSAFRPRGVPGPTSKLSPRVPAQMGRRETEHEGRKQGDRRKGETHDLRVCPAPRSGALAVGGYKRPRGREREASTRRPVLSARPTFSYECPGPSFYRRKERAQLYNRRFSSVLTCLAERS